MTSQSINHQDYGHRIMDICRIYDQRWRMHSVENIGGENEYVEISSLNIRVVIFCIFSLIKREIYSVSA